MRHFYSLLSLLFIVTLLSADSNKSYKIDHLEPPFWWTGTADNTLQLMVHGKNISKLEPKLSAPTQIYIKSLISRMSNGSVEHVARPPQKNNTSFWDILVSFYFRKRSLAVTLSSIPSDATFGTQLQLTCYLIFTIFISIFPMTMRIFFSLNLSTKLNVTKAYI